MTDTLDLILRASGCALVRVARTPRPLSDNGSSHVSGDLAEGVQGKRMTHPRGALHRRLFSQSVRVSSTTNEKYCLAQQKLDAFDEERIFRNGSTTLSLLGALLHKSVEERSSPYPGRI